VEVTLPNKLHLERTSTRVVTWNQEVNEVHCTCNSLVYAGMPCEHIISVALLRGYRIPLNCFNKRFYHETVPELDEESAAQDEAIPSAPQEALPPAEVEIEEDELHIREAGLNAKFPDSATLALRARRELEAMIVNWAHYEGTMEDANELVSQYEETFKEVAAVEKERKQHSFAFIVHTSERNKKKTNKNVPLVMKQQGVKRGAVMQGRVPTFI